MFGLWLPSFGFNLQSRYIFRHIVHVNLISLLFFYNMLVQVYIMCRIMFNTIFDQAYMFTGAQCNEQIVENIRWTRTPAMNTISIRCPKDAIRPEPVTNTSGISYLNTFVSVYSKKQDCLDHHQSCNNIKKHHHHHHYPDHHPHHDH